MSVVDDGRRSPPSSTDLIYDHIKLADNRTSMEVQELRHQVRMLSAELQQLRTNLSGSTQSLQVQCSDGLNAGVSNLSGASGRVSWTSAATGMSPNSRNFMVDDFKPPLPPRLYRPPAKPQRTFAQNGIPPSPTTQIIPAWLKSGVSADCIPTISNEGPILPPRNYNGKRMVSKLPPPLPPPKSYNRPNYLEPTNSPVLNTSMNSSSSVSNVQISSTFNVNHHTQERNNNNSKIGSIQTKMPLNSNNGLVKSFKSEYSEVCKNNPANFFRNGCRNDKHSSNSKVCFENNKIKQFSHFAEPVNEEHLLRALENGFSEGFCWYQAGPVLLYLNSFNENSPNPISFSSTKIVDKPVAKLISDVHGHFHDSELSQAIVICGERGSGKSHITMQILKQIFSSFGGKCAFYQTDAYRNFAATVDVLTSLTTIKRETSSFSNQTVPLFGQKAFLYELHVTDSILTKAKIHCCFLDESRLCSKNRNGRNFEIFYQILAGLTLDERKKFHLTGHTWNTLKYLDGTLGDSVNCNLRNVDFDKTQFHIWKSALNSLGIAFSDVMRVLASVLLLGNIKFVESKDGVELDVESSRDLEAVAALLGITSSTLYKSLTKYSTFIKRQWVKSSRSVQSIYDVRDSLAKTLYHRCICAIVRRANSLKTSIRPGSGISSSDESCAHDSGIGMACQMSEGTINSSQNSAQGADGLISVFDSFGFDNEQTNNFDQLCANYASEKLQSFYRTKLFRSNQHLLRDEGIESDYDFVLINKHSPNDDVLETFLSPKNGIFYLLDEECISPSGSSSHFYQMLKQYNKNSKNLEFVGDQQHLNFVVKHFSTTSTMYNASEFVPVNRDLLSSDVIKMFNSNSCNFGFVSHLFASELRLDERRQQIQGNYRVSPSMSATSAELNLRKSTTFCQDFIFQIDAFIKSLTSCKVHFVQCIKTNSKGDYSKYDENEVGRQLVQLDFLPLVHLLSAGFPYVVKLKEFNCRYRFLVIKYHGVFLAKAPTLIEETKVLLDCYLKAVDESNLPYVSNHWAMGSQYIFLSEGAHGQLETLRELHRTNAAMVIQKFIRHWLKKYRAPAKTANWNVVPSGRPKPLIGDTVTNGSAPVYHLVEKVVNQNNVNLDNSPPPLPAHRQYSIMGDHKAPFPQRRVMIDEFIDSQAKIKLNVGDIVTAIGYNIQQKRLIIRNPKGEMIFVPFNLTKLCVQ